MKLKNLYDFKIIDDPRINKNGNICLFTITNANEEKNDYLINFFEALEDDDDVQNIYSNAELAK